MTRRERRRWIRVGKVAVVVLIACMVVRYWGPLALAGMTLVAGFVLGRSNPERRIKAARAAVRRSPSRRRAAARVISNLSRQCVSADLYEHRWCGLKGCTCRRCGHPGITAARPVPALPADEIPF